MTRVVTSTTLPPTQVKATVLLTLVVLATAEFPEGIKAAIPKGVPLKVVSQGVPFTERDFAAASGHAALRKAERHVAKSLMCNCEVDATVVFVMSRRRDHKRTLPVSITILKHLWNFGGGTSL